MKVSKIFMHNKVCPSMEILPSPLNNVLRNHKINHRSVHKSTLKLALYNRAQISSTRLSTGSPPRLLLLLSRYASWQQVLYVQTKTMFTLSVYGLFSIQISTSSSIFASYNKQLCSEHQILDFVSIYL